MTKDNSLDALYALLGINCPALQTSEFDAEIRPIVDVFVNKIAPIIADEYSGPEISEQIERISTMIKARNISGLTDYVGSLELRG